MTDIVQVTDQNIVLQVVSTDGGTTEIIGQTSIIDVVEAGQVIYATSAGGNNTDARQAVQSFAAGQVAQATIGSTYDLASAANINTSTALGLASAAATAGSAVTISTGFVTVADWSGSTGSTNLTPKATYYLSATVAGNLTTTAPAAPGQCVVKIGTAVNTQTMLVEIEKPYLIN